MYVANKYLEWATDIQEGLKENKVNCPEQLF